MESNEAFEQAFHDYTQRRYNQLTDDKLQREGRKILDKYAPQKLGRINSHSVFWMVASFAVFYYTDFYLALRFNNRIHRPWMYIGIGLVSTTVAIATYLIVYYHYYMKIREYEKHEPYAVPLATVTFISGMIVLCYALWPVWSILTPIILFTLFMGVVFISTILPF